MVDYLKSALDRAYKRTKCYVTIDDDGYCVFVHVGDHLPEHCPDSRQLDQDAYAIEHDC